MRHGEGRLLNYRGVSLDEVRGEGRFGGCKAESCWINRFHGSRSTGPRVRARVNASRSHVIFWRGAGMIEIEPVGN